MTSESEANARGVLSSDTSVAARQLANNPGAQYYYADSPSFQSSSSVSPAIVVTGPGSWKGFFWACAIIGPIMLWGYYQFSVAPREQRAQRDREMFDRVTKASSPQSDMELAIRRDYGLKAARFIDQYLSMKLVAGGPPEKFIEIEGLRQLHALADKMGLQENFRKDVSVYDTIWIDGPARQRGSFEKFVEGGYGNLSSKNILEGAQRIAAALRANPGFAFFIGRPEFAEARKALEGVDEALSFARMGSFGPLTEADKAKIKAAGPK